MERLRGLLWPLLLLLVLLSCGLLLSRAESSSQRSAQCCLDSSPWAHTWDEQEHIVPATVQETALDEPRHWRQCSCTHQDQTVCCFGWDSHLLRLDPEVCPSQRLEVWKSEVCLWITLSPLASHKCPFAGVSSDLKLLLFSAFGCSACL